jgi:UDP-glucose 4-epimerase
MAFHRFCRSIIGREPLRIFDDGSQTRDFTYISDVVEANIRAAMSDAATGQVMNIAGGSRVTLHDVVHLLEEIHGSPLQVVFEEKQRGDVRHTFADTRRAEQAFGYQPLVSLWQGLANEFQYVVALYQGSYAVRA